MIGASRWTYGRGPLRPGVPIPLPSVGKAGITVTISSESSKQDHPPALAVIGQGMSDSSRWAYGRGPLRPGVPIPLPSDGEVGATTIPSEQDQAPPRSVESKRKT